MEVIIHCGTHQIGGCVTEIRTKQARIFIDMGEELPGEGTHIAPPKIEGVTDGQADCDGMFFTHYHGDHIGRYAAVLEGIPLFMGTAAKEIFMVFQKRISVKNAEIRTALPRLEAIKTFVPAHPVQIGDIKITPFQVDHSAYDAYMLLIEAEGKKILHMGDFRTHGFRGKGVIPTLQKHVGKVDLLITEGTTLSRKDAPALTEYELSKQAKEYFGKYKYVFVLCSSTNIDRIAAMHSATPVGKYFICDGYQKDILKVAERHGATKSSLYSFTKVLTYGNNLLPKLKERGFCMLVRANECFSQIMEQFGKEDSIILYSMWKGYLKDEKMSIANFLNGYNYDYLHTSGHATRAAIMEVCKTVAPRNGIVTIHSDAPWNMDKLNLSAPIIHLKDKEILTV